VFVLYEWLFPLPVSGVSVEREDALVVAPVVTAGVGDVGEPWLRNAPVTRLRMAAWAFGWFPVRTRRELRHSAVRLARNQCSYYVLYHVDRLEPGG
jgi:hypothetical protein